MCLCDGTPVQPHGNMSCVSFRVSSHVSPSGCLLHYFWQELQEVFISQLIANLNLGTFSSRINFIVKLNFVFKQPLFCAVERIMSFGQIVLIFTKPFSGSHCAANTLVRDLYEILV